MNSFQPLPSFSLLLVEDEKTVRDIISAMVVLKFPHCTIYTAEHGEEGLNLFMEHMPDIVITDLVMPIMDGIELARKIQAKKTKTKYIVISGSTNIDDKFSEIENCVCLTKPIDCNVLFKAINDCYQEIRQ